MTSGASIFRGPMEKVTACSPRPIKTHLVKGKRSTSHLSSQRPPLLATFLRMRFVFHAGHMLWNVFNAASIPNPA